MGLPTGLYRADHVGSFLRPKEILQIREDIVSKKATKQDLRAAEDKHISSLVKSELENGIRSVTDGEMRRVSSPDDWDHASTNSMANVLLFVVGFLPLRYVHALESSWRALADIFSKIISRKVRSILERGIKSNIVLELGWCQR